MWLEVGTTDFYLRYFAGIFLDEQMVFTIAENIDYIV